MKIVANGLLVKDKKEKQMSKNEAFIGRNLHCPYCGRFIGKRSSYNQGYASTEGRKCKCGSLVWIDGDGAVRRTVDVS